MNLDEMREQAHAERDPQNETEPSPEECNEKIIECLYDVETALDGIRKQIAETRNAARTCKLNHIDRLLSEAEDKVEKMLERGF